MSSSVIAKPPLRPLAPKPIISRSMTATFIDGSDSRSWYAVHRPV